MKHLIAKTWFVPALILMVGGLLYIPFLGRVHLFDWDEINFAESAREMLVSGNYLDVQINFETFWEKPPLFIWLQVLSMKVFGVNEFAARFPNAVIGIVTLLVLYFVGKKVLNKKFALIWTATYAVSLLPFLYFKSGIIDPLFNLCIFLGIYFFSKFNLSTQNKYIFLLFSAVFIGLGILTKGPVALLIFLLTAFAYMLFRKRFKLFFNPKVLLVYGIGVALVGGFWFILQYLHGNAQILSDFITYQIRLFSTKDAGHGGFLLYHFVVVFVGVFPASIFLLMGYKLDKEQDAVVQDFHFWMKILMWVVLILFTIVSTKIVHYSSMAYFPVSFIGAYGVYLWMQGARPVKKWFKILLTSIASLWGLGIFGITFVGLNTKRIIASGLIQDVFANANLAANVHWSGFEILIGIGFLLGVVLALYVVKDTWRKIGLLYVSTLLFIYTTLVFVVPKIEVYSQNAALEFYQKNSGQDVYIITYGFKSYAHLFYFEKPLPIEAIHSDHEGLMAGNTEKEVLVVCKINKEKELQELYPNFLKLYDKNGFVFFSNKENNKP